MRDCGICRVQTRRGGICIWLNRLEIFFDWRWCRFHIGRHLDLGTALCLRFGPLSVFWQTVEEWEKCR